MHALTVAFIVVLGQPSVSADIPCAVTSVLDLGKLLAHDITADQRRRLVESYPEEEASMWLTDEEYSPLVMLVEDLREQGLSVDPRLEALLHAPQEECNGAMVLVLESPEGSPAPG